MGWPEVPGEHGVFCCCSLLRRHIQVMPVENNAGTGSKKTEEQGFCSLRIP